MKKAELSAVPDHGKWSGIANSINQNFTRINQAIESQEVSVKMPHLTTLEAANQLQSKYKGQLILVGDTRPLKYFKYNGSSWDDTGLEFNDASVDLQEYYKKADIDTQNQSIENKIKGVEGAKANKNEVVAIKDLLQEIGDNDKLPMSQGAVTRVMGLMKQETDSMISELSNKTDETSCELLSTKDISKEFRIVTDQPSDFLYSLSNLNPGDTVTFSSDDNISRIDFKYAGQKPICSLRQGGDTVKVVIGKTYSGKIDIRPSAAENCTVKLDIIRYKDAIASTRQEDIYNTVSNSIPRKITYTEENAEDEIEMDFSSVVEGGLFDERLLIKQQNVKYVNYKTLIVPIFKGDHVSSTLYFSDSSRAFVVVDKANKVIKKITWEKETKEIAYKAENDGKIYISVHPTAFYGVTVQRDITDSDNNIFRLSVFFNNGKIKDGDGFTRTLEKLMPARPCTLYIDKHYNNDISELHGGLNQVYAMLALGREKSVLQKNGVARKGFNGDEIVGVRGNTLTRTFIEITGDCIVRDLDLFNCVIFLNGAFNEDIKLILKNCNLRGYTKVYSCIMEENTAPLVELNFVDNKCTTKGFEGTNAGGFIELVRAKNSIIARNEFKASQRMLSEGNSQRVMLFGALISSDISFNKIDGGVTGIEMMGTAFDKSKSEKIKTNGRKTKYAFVFRNNYIHNNNIINVSEESIGFDTAGGYEGLYSDNNTAKCISFKITTLADERIKVSNSATIKLTNKDEFFKYRIGLVLCNAGKGKHLKYTEISSIERNVDDTDFSMWDIEVEDVSFFYYEHVGYSEKEEVSKNDLLLITGGYINNVIADNNFEGRGSVIMYHLVYGNRVMHNNFKGYGGSIYTSRTYMHKVLPYAPIVDTKITGNYMPGGKINCHASYDDMSVSDENIEKYSEQMTIISNNTASHITCSNNIAAGKNQHILGKDIFITDNIIINFLQKQKGQNIVYDRNTLLYEQKQII